MDNKKNKVNLILNKIKNSTTEIIKKNYKNKKKYSYSVKNDNKDYNDNTTIINFHKLFNHKKEDILKKLKTLKNEKPKKIENIFKKKSRKLFYRKFNYKKKEKKWLKKDSISNSDKEINNIIELAENNHINNKNKLKKIFNNT